MSFKNITIAGSGVLGYQIACQAAYHGFKVTVYDINDEVLEKAKEKFDGLAASYKKDLQATPEQIDAARSNLAYSSNLSEAVKDADLVIEAVPEDVKIKTAFYQELNEVAPEHTVFASNSSTLLPSQFAEATGRPARFLSLHFANQIWLRNTAEIMGHPGTDKALFDEAVQFAREIGMVPIMLHKEQPGYVLNTMLSPFLNAGMELWVNGIADAPTIDKTWMAGTGSPLGPMAFYDVIGITTPYNIYKIQAENGNEADEKIIEMLEKKFIGPNKLGVSTGEGFYTYPDPEFQQPGFLKAPAPDLNKVHIKNVTVAGSGVLGYQIAFHTAFHGFKVTVYDVSEAEINKAKAKFEGLAESYRKDIQATAEQIEATQANLGYSADLAAAVSDADLVIEAVPESEDIKKKFYGELGESAPEKTIFASNSSTLLPSRLTTFTDRPGKFLNLHFANHIHIRNTAEVMAAKETDAKVYEEIVEFAKAIGMIPITLKQEKSGYVLDSLLIPLLLAGLYLWANEVADPATIDKTWMVATGAPFGPMAILDKNGMNTNYNIIRSLPDDQFQAIAEKLKSELIDKGKLGEASGEGFYHYPDPEYLKPNFLKS